jgi:plasmid stability protein
MSTIQVRDVPESVHRVYRARAAAAGQSLQEYLLAELIEGARLRAPGEIAADVEAEIAAEEGAGYSTVSATAYVRRDRDAR